MTRQSQWGWRNEHDTNSVQEDGQLPVAGPFAKGTPHQTTARGLDLTNDRHLLGNARCMLILHRPTGGRPPPEAPRLAR